MITKSIKHQKNYAKYKHIHTSTQEHTRFLWKPRWEKPWWEKVALVYCPNPTSQKNIELHVFCRHQSTLLIYMHQPTRDSNPLIKNWAPTQLLSTDLDYEAPTSNSWKHNQVRSAHIQSHTPLNSFVSQFWIRQYAHAYMDTSYANLKLSFAHILCTHYLHNILLTSYLNTLLGLPFPMFQNCKIYKILMFSLFFQKNV